jgi:Tfp pilus assembly protein PilF
MTQATNNPSVLGQATGTGGRAYTRSVRLALVFLLLIAQGCASAARRDYYFLTQEQWQQELRRRGVNPEEVPYPLLVTDAMRQTARDFAGPGSPHERLKRLQLSLFSETAFPFKYESHNTLTAAEAFHRREGNCLSFTNLFVALGRSLNLPVTTALVRRRNQSEKEGDLIVVNNHVVASMRNDLGQETYDFDIQRKEKIISSRPLDDLWITAFYLNNRGADELRARHPEIALRYFLWTVKLAPEFAPGWGNVGVAYRRMGEYKSAFNAYEKALGLEPNNPTILNNLSALYRATGRIREAEAAVAAVNVSEASPHVIIVRGDLELARGNVDQAVKLYKRAKRMAPNIADPLIALARAEIARSHSSRARSYAEKALKLEPDNRDAIELLGRLTPVGMAGHIVVGSAR